MREIKFRAWHEQGKEMVCFKSEKLVNDQYQMQHLAHLINGDYGDVLMQYTGLKDIDGVEIYECDIVREAFLGFKFHVQFNTVTAQFEAVPIDENPCHAIPLFERDFIVIGNIYENPELLESL